MNTNWSLENSGWRIIEKVNISECVIHIVPKQQRSTNIFQINNWHQLIKSKQFVFNYFLFLNLYSNQYFSIYSSVFPLVSGIIFHPIHMVGMQKNAKIQNVIAGPKLSSESGINCPIIEVPIQTAIVAIDMALPRIFVWYISYIITQTTGPSENANDAI